jgi:hypothetical protein
MINIVRSKLTDCNYPDGLKELNKILGAAKFIFEEKSRGCIPPYEECLLAITELDNIQGKNRTGSAEQIFNEIKTEALTVCDSLVLFFNQPNRKELFESVFYGATRSKAEKELKYSLLLVEQENIDFFKERPSRLSSQEHDRLSFHMWIYSTDSEIKFGFVDDSELPEYIRQEVGLAFSETMKPFAQRI